MRRGERKGPERRYPLQPLLDLLAERGVPQSHKQLRMAIGISGTTLNEARTNGLVARAADRYAGRAGVHPAELWPSWFDDALEDDLRRSGKDCAECGARFIPRQKGHKYCQALCRNRAVNRAYLRRIRAQWTDEQRRAAAARVQAWRDGLSPAALRAVKVKHKKSKARWEAANRDRVRETAARRARERYWSDPEFRERTLARNREADRRRRAARKANADAA